jgi:hypothetical protein
MMTVPASCRARAVGRRALLVGVAIMAFAVTPPQTGLADSPNGVMVTARSLEPIPAGAAIFVKVLDNSPANLRLRTVIKRELAAQSRSLTDEAPLVLRFTADHVDAIKLRVHASLEWHETGKVLWRGDAVGSLSGAREETLGPELAVALIGQLGRNVEPPH